MEKEKLDTAIVREYCVLALRTKVLSKVFDCGQCKLVHAVASCKSPVKSRNHDTPRLFTVALAVSHNIWYIAFRLSWPCM